MFWASSTKRNDSHTSHSESATSDPDDTWARSKRNEKRSKKKRRADSNNNSSWFGALVASTRPSNRKKSGKKDKKSKMKRRCCNIISPQNFGRILLGTLLVIYILNFFNVLYSDRPKDSHAVRSNSSITHDSNRMPVNAADVGTSTGTSESTTTSTSTSAGTSPSTSTSTSSNTGQSLGQASVHQAAGQAQDQSQTGENSSGASSSNPGNQQTAADSSVAGSNAAGSGAAGSGAGGDLHGNQQTTTSSTEAGSHAAASEQAPKELEKHPMNRNMLELQVPGNTGILSTDTVKDYYRKLAKAYLQTFTGGIHRQMYFDILRRRTYSLTPPGANKGIQTILFQIIDKKVHMMDPYEVPRNSKPFYRTRINQVIWLLSKLCREGRIKNTEFLMAIHDCVQTVNKPHTYRGAHYSESNPAFTIVSCNFSDNIPFPMWEGTKHRDGGFEGWDETMKHYAEDDISWERKQDRAVFRGGNRPSMYFLNKTDADLHCDDVGRTRLLYLAQQQPDAFDVSVGGTCGGKHAMLQRLDAKDHHKFKYILYAEGNCMWADRSKQQLFGPSAMIKQETPCGQFFEPLLKPEIHYIPTDFFFTDTIDKIKWARQNDAAVTQIVKNANEFGKNFLSLNGIETYVEVLLEEYTGLLVEPDVKLENGAIDVTDKEV